MLKTFKRGGIHIPENKLTAGKGIIDMPDPREIVIPLSQHIGEPAVCKVKVGVHVDKWDMIAEANGKISANIHSPISGVVKKIDKSRDASGYYTNAVTIVSGEDNIDNAENGASSVRTVAGINKLSSDEIISAIEDAGIVGLGGAAFPTSPKLLSAKESKVDVVIVNGVECEPYLTNDHALMLEETEGIVAGVRYLIKAVNARKAIIAIENNKTDAIASFMQIVEDDPYISVTALKVKYPQGGEKQLIDAVLNKEVATGELPVNAGALVQNVATVYAIYRAVKYGEPLTHRIITVTGPGIKKPGNYRVAIGTSIERIIEFAGGMPEDAGKVVIGGPMMGHAALSTDVPVTKGMTGILVLPRNQEEKDMQPCVRCASCVNACPMGLEPYLLMTLAEMDEFEQAENNFIRNCMECGCCSYSCPSNRPLLEYIKLGKTRIVEMLKNKDIKAPVKK